MRLAAFDFKSLKKDIFGEVSLRNDEAGLRVVRDASMARPWARWLARRLLAREARALASMDDIAGIPELLRVEQLHRQDVVHNDLAKEPNWLVMENGQPGIIDFQLAWYSPKRGRLFRLLAREDVRHLLKHKRTYCPEHLTAREHAILARPTVPSRIWMRGGKPVYLFITRRILGWADREGASDRTGY